MRKIFPNFYFYSLQHEFEKMLASSDYMYAVRPEIYSKLKKIGISCPDLKIGNDQQTIFLQSLIRLSVGRHFKSKMMEQNNIVIETSNEAFRFENEVRITKLFGLIKTNNKNTYDEKTDLQ